MNRSEILENIRDQIGEQNLFDGNSFRRGQCSVNLAGVSEDNRVVVDLDKVFPGGQEEENQCECVIFYFDTTANFVVVPMELKGGRNAEAVKSSKTVKRVELPLPLPTYRVVLKLSAVRFFFTVELTKLKSHSLKSLSRKCLSVENHLRLRLRAVVTS